LFFLRNENYVWSTNLEFNEADKKIRMIQPSSEYGIVLLAWTLLHLKGKFGIKSNQKLEVYTEAISALKMWPSLLEMCQSSAIKVNIFYLYIIINCCFIYLYVRLINLNFRITQ
jgi:hypothetical protein